MKCCFRGPGRGYLGEYIPRTDHISIGTLSFTYNCHASNDWWIVCWLRIAVSACFRVTFSSRWLDGLDEKLHFGSVLYQHWSKNAPNTFSHLLLYPQGWQSQNIRGNVVGCGVMSDHKVRLVSWCNARSGILGQHFMNTGPKILQTLSFTYFCTPNNGRL
mgnify:CR=1 FL=1